MRRSALPAAVLATLIVGGCGDGRSNAPAKPLQRVDVERSQTTDIGSLPTVAPPPGLELGPRGGNQDEGGAATATPTASSTSTTASPTPTAVVTPPPTRTATPLATPTVTFEPEG